MASSVCTATPRGEESCFQQWRGAEDAHWDTPTRWDMNRVLVVYNVHVVVVLHFVDNTHIDHSRKSMIYICTVRVDNLRLHFVYRVDVGSVLLI